MDSSFYYYYKGEKQHIELNTKQAFVNMPISNVRNLNFNQKSYNIVQIVAGTDSNFSEIHFSNTMSTVQYIEKINSLRNSNIPAEVYFKIDDNDRTRLSDYFYIKLKQLSDSSLLRAEAQRLGIEVLLPNLYMPHWILMRKPSAASIDVLTTMNLLYESGLFQSVSPSFMSDKSQFSCANDPLFPQQWALKNTGQNV
jgi:hypothetical protein